jgi:uncharacterized membrane protein
MNQLLATPERALGLGVAAMLAMALLALAQGVLDWSGAATLVVRAAHVLLAMAWVGLIWFVNRVQLEVLREADDADRAAVLRWIVPRVAAQFRMAATWTVVSGLVLLVAMGYLNRAPFGAVLWLWFGSALGLVMLGIVHGKIAPALRIVLDPNVQDVALKTAARETVRFYARCNLVLAVPVTVAMLVAAHA